ncbi:MAG: hypothetical protein EPN82_01200 [Bacteroidetes bacterium]|nr:MAG: hypothetical protein EPN82_01200 [Bacteroidota bacterium]
MFGRKIYYLLILIFFTSCGLFNTRNPEEPDRGKSTFYTPVRPDTVVSNFIYAIKEKNTENYIKCFWDTLDNPGLNYSFIPSPDAIALYQTIFNSWDINSERNYFLNLISIIPEDEYPQLELINKDYPVQQSNSWTFVADYILTFKNDKDTTFAYAGKLQFIIQYKDNKSLWYIQKWIDTNPSNDSIKSTWSILKAQFAK